MSILQLPLSIDDLEYAWLKEDYAEGWGKTGKAIVARNGTPNPDVIGVGGFTLGGGVTFSAPGGGELLLTKSGGTNAGFVYVEGGNAPGVFRGAMKAGRTYTFSALGRVGTYSTVGEHSTASRRISLSYLDSVGAVQSFYSNPVPSDGSSGKVYVTVAIPVDATGAFFRMFLGSAVEADQIYWSKPILSEGPYPATFFSGASADDAVFDYQWEGVANNSSSIKKSIAGPPVTFVNLFPNPDLVNDDLALVGAARATASLDYTGNLPGLRSWKLTSTGAVGGGYALFFGSGFYPSLETSCVPGDIISVGVRVRALGQYARAEVIFFDGTSTALRTDMSPPVFNASNSYIAYTSLSAPAGTVRYQIVVRVNTDSSFGTTVVPGLEFSANDLIVSRNSPITGYIGAIDKRWTGAKYASSVAYLSDRTTLGDLEHSYWAKRSSLTPKEQFSLGDHMLNALRASYVAVAGDPITVVRKNFFPDPRLDSGGTAATLGLTIYGTSNTYSNDAVDFYSAPYSGKITSGAASPQGRAYRIPCKEGDVVNVKFRAKSAVDQVLCNYAFTDVVGSPTGATVVPASSHVADDTWREISFTSGPAYARSAFCDIRFYTNSTVIGNFFNIDDILIEVNTSGAFFYGGSGSTTRWSGSANASVSEMTDPSQNGITDLLMAFYMAGSGLPTNQKWSLADHEMAFYKAKLGL